MKQYVITTFFACALFSFSMPGMDCCCPKQQHSPETQLSVLAVPPSRDSKRSPSKSRSARVISVSPKKAGVSPTVSSARKRAHRSPDKYQFPDTPIPGQVISRTVRRSALDDMIINIDPSAARSQEDRDNLLRLAVMAKKAHAIQELLIGGANPYAIDARNGDTAITLAHQYDDKEINALLVKAAHERAHRSPH